MLPPVEHAEYVAGVSEEIVRFAGLVANADLDAPVPSCPEWDLGKLTRHSGTVHRWIAHILRSGSTERVSPREVDLGLPTQRTGLPAWLAAGASPLRAALATDPNRPVWTWGPGGTAGWWARRALHETTVHRMDAQLALGLEPELSPTVAYDGIEEFLTNLPAVAADNIKGLPAGDSLHLHATDGPGEWTIQLADGGFTWNSEHGKAAVALRGTLVDLLLLLYGRRRPHDGDRFEAFGDLAVADRWLAATQL
ncbi:maleylpyruvate isomerase family mycothiol-dependent enzyme [Sporichthya brevicatena]|uniref:Maleylpyruvate isomerase family mycothiol-dependent enzyme n=1 Tax=Sporichthya brevicatena TaxID=171442 RepID=A0ABP3S280_9ACTN